MVRTPTEGSGHSPLSQDGSKRKFNGGQCGGWRCAGVLRPDKMVPKLTSRQVSEDMPLRCLGPDGQSIQSFDLPEAEWLALRLENSRSRQLRMPCCDASMVMKTPTRGLKFFSPGRDVPIRRHLLGCGSGCAMLLAASLRRLTGELARRSGLRSWAAFFWRGSGWSASARLGMLRVPEHPSGR